MFQLILQIEEKKYVFEITIDRKKLDGLKSIVFLRSDKISIRKPSWRLSQKQQGALVLTWTSFDEKFPTSKVLFDYQWRISVKEFSTLPILTTEREPHEVDGNRVKAYFILIFVLKNFFATLFFLSVFIFALGWTFIEFRFCFCPNRIAILFSTTKNIFNSVKEIDKCRYNSIFLWHQIITLRKKNHWK